jgi:hypothetical protein
MYQCKCKFQLIFKKIFNFDLLTVYNYIINEKTSIIEIIIQEKFFL